MSYRDEWPKALPSPNEVWEHKCDDDNRDSYNGFQGELVWIEYTPSYGNYGWAYLCYWPNESRENHDGTRGGRPVRLAFRCRRDAREWYSLNITKELCPSCLDKAKSPPGGDYCRECGEALAELRELEGRHKEMLRRRHSANLVHERILELRKLLGNDEFTIADKAIVLDRLLSEDLDDDECLAPTTDN